MYWLRSWLPGQSLGCMQFYRASLNGAQLHPNAGGGSCQATIGRCPQKCIHKTTPQCQGRPRGPGPSVGPWGRPRGLGGDGAGEGPGGGDGAGEGSSQVRLGCMSSVSICIPSDIKMCEPPYAGMCTDRDKGISTHMRSYCGPNRNDIS